MYLVRIDLEMQRPKIVQGWRTENYMRVGTALAYRSVSWYVLYHDHRIAIHIVSWPTRIVTPLCCSTTEIELRWMPQNTFDDKSTLVLVMACCRRATSHYLSQCRPRPKSTYGVTRPHTKLSYWLLGEVTCLHQYFWNVWYNHIETRGYLGSIRQRAMTWINVNSLKPR